MELKCYPSIRTNLAVTLTANIIHPVLHQFASLLVCLKITDPLEEPLDMMELRHLNQIF